MKGDSKMRQGRVEIIISQILEIQYELESIRRSHQLKSDSPIGAGDHLDGEIKTAISYMARAIDELIYMAREESLARPVTMKDKVKRMIHG